MTFASRVRVGLLLAALFGASVASAQPISGNGVIINPAPMYLVPDPSRIPLATLPAGTNVRVLAREGDWVRIVYRDRYLGDRTGYVLAASVRIEPVAAPPATAAPPPPAVPGQVAPQASPTQPSRPPAQIKVDREHGYFWLSGTRQDETTAFTATTTFAANGGTGTATTTYDGVQPIVADVAIGQHLWNGIGFQLAGSWAAQITDALVTASVPAPVAGIGARTVSGRAAEINRQELAVHLDVSVAFPVTHSRAQVVVFAGPTLFRLKQGLVTGVTVNETPPFDTATFATASVAEETKQRFGYNAGAEVSVRLYRALGIGALVRYSKADVPFSPVPGADVTIKAGGTQAGAGLHFRF